MTTDRCDRKWQVEALYDGRLELKDRDSFDRHAHTCRVCSAQLVRLRELHQIMSEAPTAERSDLERRRARIALLGEANRRVVERQAPSRKVRIGALAAALLFLGLCTVTLARHSSRRNLPGFEVVNIAQSDWIADKAGTTSRVTLRSGVASFHVEHVAKGARFLVLLPDGEIEVRGTRFVVDVAAGQTRSVLVTEGVVALRLGGAELVLHPGDRWQKGYDVASRSVSARQEQEPVAQVAPPTAAASLIVSGNAMPEGNPAAQTKAGNPRPAVMRVVSLTSEQRAASGVRTMSMASNKSETATRLEPSVGSAGVRFAEAVAAFGAGDYGRADSLFGAFARDFASDSRAEDASFLRADARARRGDKAGAAAVARVYIQAYPNGLRRPEAERLAEDH